MPERIQLRRTKGWRLPIEAVTVARPTRFGNPFHVKHLACAAHPGSMCWSVELGYTSYADHLNGQQEAHQRAVDLYREHVIGILAPVTFMQWRAKLYGHPLACWCPLDFPCHGDTLLEVMN